MLQIQNLNKLTCCQTSNRRNLNRMICFDKRHNIRQRYTYSVPNMINLDRNVIYNYDLFARL